MSIISSDTKDWVKNMPLFKKAAISLFLDRIKTETKGSYSRYHNAVVIVHQYKKNPVSVYVLNDKGFMIGEMASLPFDDVYAVYEILVKAEEANNYRGNNGREDDD